MRKVRRLCDNKSGYAIEKRGSLLTVAWENEKRISIIDEKDVITHEDDAALQIMCDMMCGNLEVDM